MFHLGRELREKYEGRGEKREGDDENRWNEEVGWRTEWRGRRERRRCCQVVCFVSAVYTADAARGTPPFYALKRVPASTLFSNRVRTCSRDCVCCMCCMCLCMCVLWVAYMRHISYTCRLKTLFNKLVLSATLIQLIFLKQPLELIRPLIWFQSPKE